MLFKPEGYSIDKHFLSPAKTTTKPPAFSVDSSRVSIRRYEPITPPDTYKTPIAHHDLYNDVSIKPHAYPSLISLIGEGVFFKNQLPSNILNNSYSVPVYTTPLIDSLRFIVLKEFCESPVSNTVILHKHLVILSKPHNSVSLNEILTNLSSAICSEESIPSSIPNEEDLQSSLPILQTDQLNSFLSKLDPRYFTVTKDIEVTNFSFTSKDLSRTFIETESSHPLEQFIEALSRSYDIDDTEVRTDEVICFPTENEAIESDLFSLEPLSRTCRLFPTEWIRDPAETEQYEVSGDEELIVSDPSRIVCGAADSTDSFKFVQGLLILRYNLTSVLRQFKKSMLAGSQIATLEAEEAELDEPSYVPDEPSTSSEIESLD